MFSIFKKKKCKCKFNIDDVINLKIDPKCVYCGKHLSEYEKQNK